MRVSECCCGGDEEEEEKEKVVVRVQRRIFRQTRDTPPPRIDREISKCPGCFYWRGSTSHRAFFSSSYGVFCFWVNCWFLLFCNFWVVRYCFLLLGGYLTWYLNGGILYIDTVTCIDNQHSMQHFMKILEGHNYISMEMVPNDALR